MPEDEPFEADMSRVRSEEEERSGLLPCLRCGHIEQLHTEGGGEEEGDVYCHAPDCSCAGFVSEFGIA